MSNADNNSGWAAEGAIQEQGKLALETMNTFSQQHQVVFGVAVNFRSVASLSSITLLANDSLTINAGQPEVYNVSGSGFVARILPTLLANQHARWIGSYTAV